MKTGKHKVKEICDILRQETLEPARAEAEKIVREAETQADQIVHKAKERSEYLLDEARKEIDEERRVFQSSLALSAKQVVASLKEDIESKVFTDATGEMAKGATGGKEIAAAFVNAIVGAIEKSGIEGDLLAEVSGSVKPQEVAALLAAGVKKRLGKEPVVVKDLQGGVRVKCEKDNLTLDLSDETVKELLASYARDDFRKLIFG